MYFNSNFPSNKKRIRVYYVFLLKEYGCLFMYFFVETKELGFIGKIKGRKREFPYQKNAHGYFFNAFYNVEILFFFFFGNFRQNKFSERTSYLLSSFVIKCSVFLSEEPRKKITAWWPLKYERNPQNVFFFFFYCEFTVCFGMHSL